MKLTTPLKKLAAEPYYQGILTVTDEELVSTDCIGNSHSAIVDLKTTAVVGGNFAKGRRLYDNEWGYSNRLVEMVADTGKNIYISKFTRARLRTNDMRIYIGADHNGFSLKGLW